MQRLLAPVVAAFLLGGCAVGKDPRDPLENFNRAMFKVNDGIDTYALKPAAEAYRATLPEFVQTGVYNFFGNLGDVWTLVNEVLQGRVADGANDVMRVAINSFLGFGGVLDVASEAGLPKHKQDFGATLGTWGVPAGPYVMLPFFGPSNVRDTIALPVDVNGDLYWYYADPVWVRNTGIAIRVIDTRANLLDAGSLVEEAALDRYAFLRDGYIQRRESKIRDNREDRIPRREEGESDGKGGEKR
jgi:phospholipid-binding lipoprotein MlaA